jgi:hypothetical protein
MIRIHSSLHKCLTVYHLRVMDALYNRWRPGSRQYCHYAAMQEAFYANLHRHRVISANNFAVDINRLDQDFRIVRFVRDPRDLVVSGYFYHRRGAEPWFRCADPTPEYWLAINGAVPHGMQPGHSLADHLGSLSIENGLIAEIQFRRHHFESLRKWQSDSRIRLYRYEDIIGNEARVFREIFEFYELSRIEGLLGTWLAARFAAGRRRGDRHIRNPAPRQWKQYFTPAVREYFDSRYADIPELLGYSA